MCTCPRESLKKIERMTGKGSNENRKRNKDAPRIERRKNVIQNKN